MFERDDDVIARMVEQLRRPVTVDEGLDARIMATVSALPARRARGPFAAAWRWLARPRVLTLSPLAGLAVAAGVAALAFILPVRRAGRSRTAPPATRVFEFGVAAPNAARVALVGDFNDWDPTRTPMRHTNAADSVWTAVLPLSPGRYRYAFLVDGMRWLADPGAPAVGDDEFGTPSSVVTVGGGT